MLPFKANWDKLLTKPTSIIVNTGPTKKDNMNVCLTPSKVPTTKADEIAWRKGFSNSVLLTEVSSEVSLLDRKCHINLRPKNGLKQL